MLALRFALVVALVALSPAAEACTADCILEKLEDPPVCNVSRDECNEFVCGILEDVGGAIKQDVPDIC